MTELRVVLCTVPERDALRLAHALVDDRLAACVNIVPAVTSVYRWTGEVCEDKEALLVIKTTADAMGRLTRSVLLQHSYEVPEVIALPIAPDEGNSEYLKWLVDCVGPEPSLGG